MSNISQNANDPAQRNFYAAVPAHRPPEVIFAGSPALGIAIQAIEVCQSVQARDNSVALVMRKPTLVRVFLDQSSVTGSVRLRGELIWRSSPTGPANFLAGLNEVLLDPAATEDHDDKREVLAHSLNFRLPPEASEVGVLHLELNRLIQTGGPDQPFSGPRALQVEFHDGPPIRVRCIGLRYRDAATGQMHAPEAVHFDYFRSYLLRAYPVAEVIWSQIVVDADFEAPFNDSTSILANAQVAAIRNSEINSGTDRRTHYYGLVDDANRRNFMRGRASGIPAGPQPDTVASGPCGTPDGFAGDTDLSYADWYGAHELGHTFGRYHPGFPPGSQDDSDANFPYSNGQISSADRLFVGYDVGDPALALGEQVLVGTQHHDVMTYADRQWVSAYTFEAIRQRLIAEDALFEAPGN